MNKSKATINHDEIIQWAEKRGAKPARVVGTGGRGDVGMIRFDFPGYSGERSLKAISWDDFFKKFDESQLALVYRDDTAAGQKSNFNKLVGRETVALRQHSARKVASPRRRAKQAVGRRASTRTTARKGASRKRKAA